MNRKIHLILLIAPVIMLGCSRCSSLTGVSGADTVHNDSPKEIVKAKEPPKEISLADLMSVGGESDNAKVSTRSAREGDSHKQDITGLERVYLRGGNGKVLTQDMIGTKLRRYVIEGTFDLEGKKLVMPYGSVLDLEEGELRNGSIVMDQTRVTPVYGISRQTRIKNVKVSGDYFETLVDLWGVSDQPLFPWDSTPPRRVYTVDLKKFGITPGYQIRRSDGHYSDSQYDLMYRNGVGFTKAIQWASQNGYDGIRFPKNDYCFTPRTVGEKNSPECGQVLVQDLVKFDIDLGGGSYYNILDSSVKSKYYKGTGESFEQRSFMFWIARCINLSIHNGVFIGDRVLRDFTHAKEVNFDQTYGIVVGSYAYNIRMHHLDMSSFMGDGIAMLQTGEYFDSYEGTKITPSHNSVSVSIPEKQSLSGKSIINESRSVTEIMKLSKQTQDPFINAIKSQKIYYINNNRGYTRIPNIYLNVDILTFREGKYDVPNRVLKTSYLNSFKLNDDESAFKVRFHYDEGVGRDGFKHNVTITGPIPENCIVENCRIHDNHRGGITGGNNNTIIRDSWFSKNLTETNYRNKTIPVFTMGATNYHIDYEDCFGEGLEIYNCVFKSPKELVGRLLFGVLTLDFHDNKSDNPVIVYNNLFSNIHHNTFTTTGLGLSGWFLTNNVRYQNELGCKYLTRVIYFHDNRVGSNDAPSSQYRTLVIEDNNARSRR